MDQEGITPSEVTQSQNENHVNTLHEGTNVQYIIYTYIIYNIQYMFAHMYKCKQMNMEAQYNTLNGVKEERNTNNGHPSHERGYKESHFFSF